MKNLYAALLRVRMALPSVAKTATNPFYHSQYAPLDEIMAAVQPLLIAEGVLHQESIQFDPATNTSWLETMLIHVESSERIESRYALLPEKQTPQGMGIAITYARRYALQPMLGIVPEDDDGNGAEPKYNTTRTQPQHKGVDFSKVPERVSPQEAGSERIEGLWDTGENTSQLPSVSPLYVVVRQHMMQTHQALMTAAAAKAEGRPASAAQYKFLAGTIDSLTDGKHGIVLSALCNREISKDNPPSSSFCSDLLNVLLEQSKDKETGEYVDNPKFSPTQVDNIRAIAAKAKELGA